MKKIFMIMLLLIGMINLTSCSTPEPLQVCGILQNEPTDFPVTKDNNYIIELNGKYYEVKETSNSKYMFQDLEIGDNICIDEIDIIKEIK